jgi:short-subunit dehydrogenase
VLALSQSLDHELAGRGVRVKAVLPGATATDFWDSAGLPVRNLPTEIVMSAEDTVDAAVAGLNQGEIVTSPSLPDKAERDAQCAARYHPGSQVPSRPYAGRSRAGPAAS